MIKQVIIIAQIVIGKFRSESRYWYAVVNAPKIMASPIKVEIGKMMTEAGILGSLRKLSSCTALRLLIYFGGEKIVFI